MNKIFLHRRVTQAGRWLLTAAMVVVAISLPAHADEIAPFTSDGCSDFPDGTSEDQDLWLECCQQHDYAYWKGGTEEQRRQADEDLRDCVAAVGRPDIAELMLLGVRVGGAPERQTAYSWGYGWPLGRDYGELSEADLAKIAEAGKLIETPETEE
jgi:hypothetical protein